MHKLFILAFVSLVAASSCAIDPSDKTTSDKAYVIVAEGWKNSAQLKAEAQQRAATLCAADSKRIRALRLEYQEGEGAAQNKASASFSCGD